MPTLKDLAWLYLRLGCTAFGGPAVHVSMMERELVKKRAWLTSERFLDLFGAANLIPGPSSTELAIYTGYELLGLPGLVVAGICFILPAATITLAFAWAYVKFGMLTGVVGALYGLKPVIVIVVTEAVVHLASKAVKTRLLGCVGALALTACAFGLEPMAILLAAGALTALAKSAFGRRHHPSSGALALIPILGFAGGVANVSMVGLFLFFLKMGSIVFGSGYVLLAFLREDLVARWHWLTETQLLDAIAVGQVTPGPVFTTATFIGYLLLGTPGAVVATIGIFLPGFILVGVTRPLLVRLRQSPTLGACLDGVNVASLALMTWVTFQLGRAALVDLPTLVLAGVACVFTFWRKVNPAWLLIGGGCVGMALQYVRA